MECRNTNARPREGLLGFNPKLEITDIYSVRFVRRAAAASQLVVWCLRKASSK